MKLLEKSNLKNELLQKYVESEHGKELKNKMEQSGEYDGTFLKDKTSIPKAIIYCDIEQTITRKEF